MREGQGLSGPAAVCPPELPYPSIGSARPGPTHANGRPPAYPFATYWQWSLEATGTRRNLPPIRGTLTCQASFQPVSIEKMVR